jgi:transcriptional antiterminator NusG
MQSSEQSSADAIAAHPGAAPSPPNEEHAEAHPAVTQTAEEGAAHAADEAADSAAADSAAAEPASAPKRTRAKPEPEEDEDVQPISQISLEPEEIDRKWYILKIQSNREESIRDGLQRRIAIAGLDRYFGDIIVPTETVTEFKGGKKKVVKRKLYPGYLVVNMEINDDTWFLVRETPGIGDFTGRIGKPTPMLPQEIAKIISKQEEAAAEQPKVKIAFSKGDRVKIKEGTFENFEGEVDHVDETNGRVIVMINIFGRSTPVELEHWQIESI